MTDYKWWHTGIIYQIYPRSFSDTNDDGIGDIQGIISNLNYLTSLGISAIWLSPHYPSPMEDFGYDVSDYKDVHPIFGTLTDFDELVLEAHKRDIKIIIDFVPNHSSDKHEWFIESSSNRNNQKSNYYVWKDGKEDRTPPNNWISITGGSAWTWNETRKQYYLHSFLTCQPDLNWENQELREEMHNVLRFWLDRGVDGFRVDMISWISKDPEWRDDYANPEYQPGIDYGYLQLIHKYSRDGPHLHDYLKEIRKVVDEYERDILLIGEANYYLSVEELEEYYQSGIDLPANFRFLYLPWVAPSLKSFIKEYETNRPNHANYQLGNHDHTRVRSNLGSNRARVAALLLLTLRGTPFIYYGEEIGMKDVPIPPEKMQDPWEKTELGRGRDPERTPMQWISGEKAGFSKAEPWLPVSSDYKIINVQSEEEDSSSFLNMYRKLIKIRKNSLALSIGDFKFLDDSPEKSLIYQRKNDMDNFIIVLNFSTKDIMYTNTNLINGSLIFSTFMDRKEDLSKENIKIRGNEGIIIKI